MRSLKTLQADRAQGGQQTLAHVLRERGQMSFQGLGQLGRQRVDELCRPASNSTTNRLLRTRWNVRRWHRVLLYDFPGLPKRGTSRLGLEDPPSDSPALGVSIGPASTGPHGHTALLQRACGRPADSAPAGALPKFGGGSASTRKPLIVTGTNLGKGMMIRCPWCNVSSPFQEEWRGIEIPGGCPNCKGPLRVNLFVVGK